MKLILTALGATTVAAVLILNHRTDPAPVVDPPIRVVAGREPTLFATSQPTLVKPRVALQLTQASATPSPGTADADVAHFNTTPSDELFASQHRNPEWADHIETLIGAQLPRSGLITCAAYMCKATVPLPSTDTAVNSGDDLNAADQRAVLVTQHWPSEIAYNSQTAQILHGPGGASLTFFVTRNQ